MIGQAFQGGCSAVWTPMEHCPAYGKLDSVYKTFISVC